jgi:uncharacterized protein with WD repeat
MKSTLVTPLRRCRVQYIVLAGLGGAAGMTGALEFYDSQDLVSMNQDEHFMATHVEWDPTGRYVMTYVCAWKYSVCACGDWRIYACV